MKILLFTHKNDIDGMGNAVLAKLAFNNVNYILCETFDLNDKVNEFIKTSKIYEYDKIFTIMKKPGNLQYYLIR